MFGGLPSKSNPWLVCSFAFGMLIGCHQKGGLGAAQPKATLVGLAKKRFESDQRSQLEGRIVAIDGRKVKLRPGKSMKLDSGCHIVEASVNYKVTRQQDEPCPAYALGFEFCNKATYFKSGRKHFAILMKPGKRYELSVQIDATTAAAYFVEVDAELGTTAKFLPVPPETRICTGSTPVGRVETSSCHALAPSGSCTR